MCSINFKKRLQYTNERLEKYNAGCISAFCSNEDLVFFDKDGQLQLLESFDILLDIIEDLDGSITNNGCPSSRASSPSVTTNTSLLKSKLTELQYDNTRLKIDLINRPSMNDLLNCQQRVKSLEKELEEYRTNVKCDFTRFMRNEKVLEDVAVLLDVDCVESIVPNLISIQLESQKIAEIQEDMKYVLHQLLEPSDDGIDEYSKYTWQLARKASKEMKQILSGMKTLQDVFVRLYTSLECSKNSDCKKCNPLPLQPNEDVCRTASEIDCNHMARLIRHWIKHRKHLKSAQYAALLETVHHFQKLFDVNSIESIFSSMNSVYCRVQEARSAKKNLIEILLGNKGHRSWESIVSSIHTLVQDKTAGNDVLLMIHRKYPDWNGSQILQQLELSHKFYPVFYSTIQEIQHLLGVQSLSAIIPAIKRMKIAELQVKNN